jgi:hypothetical protein
MILPPASLANLLAFSLSVGPPPAYLFSNPSQSFSPGAIFVTSVPEP